MGRNNLGKTGGALALGCGGQSAEPAPTGSSRAPLSLELQGPAALQRTRLRYSTSWAHCDIYKCYTQGMKKKCPKLSKNPESAYPRGPSEATGWQLCHPISSGIGMAARMPAAAQSLELGFACLFLSIFITVVE